MLNNALVGYGTLTQYDIDYTIGHQTGSTWSDPSGGSAGDMLRDCSIHHLTASGVYSGRTWPQWLAYDYTGQDGSGTFWNYYDPQTNSYSTNFVNYVYTD
jgi:hypothetical protein